MEKKLVVLGLLMNAEMHGYQINEVIEAHLGSGIQLKKALVYKLLNTMTDDGWLTYTEEQQGNRPPRRVYAITEAGKSAFQQMVVESLADYKPADFLGNSAIGYLDMLSPEEALPLLHQRRAKAEALLQEARALGTHPGSHQFIIDHQVHHMTSELAWLDHVIATVKGANSDE
jgi:DNA-binding PadR family transcriptional regulator